MEQLSELLKRHQWIMQSQVRRGQGKRFIYAKKRVSGRMMTRYIGAESKIDTMTEEQILAKLTL